MLVVGVTFVLPYAIRPIDKIYGNPINEQDYKDPYKKTSCCLLFNQEHNVVEQLSHHHVNQQMDAISIT